MRDIIDQIQSTIVVCNIVDQNRASLITRSCLGTGLDISELGFRYKLNESLAQLSCLGTMFPVPIEYALMILSFMIELFQNYASHYGLHP